MTLLDVSVGGFFATAVRPFSSSVPLQFEFTSREPGWRVQLAATLIYRTRRDVPGSPRPEYVHGFEFVSTDEPAVAADIASLAGQPM